MTTNNHTTTISGTEYLEYAELKNKKINYASCISTMAKEYYAKIKELEENNTITVDIKHNFKQYTRHPEETSFYIHNPDSLKEQKNLLEFINKTIEPVFRENKNLKYNFEDLENSYKKSIKTNNEIKENFQEYLNKNEIFKKSLVSYCVITTLIIAVLAVVIFT